MNLIAFNFTTSLTVLLNLPIVRKSYKIYRNGELQIMIVKKHNGEKKSRMVINVIVIDFQKFK